MNKHLILTLLLIAMLFTGCQPQPQPLTGPDPTAVAALVGSLSTASSLPDLVVSHVYLGMQGVPAGGAECVANYAPFEIRAVIRNQGEAPASNILVSEQITGASLTIGQLGAGQGAELVFPQASPSGAYNIMVDPQNAIAESNEDNNSLPYIAITPTPPVLCTSAPAPSPDLATPVPYNEPESAALSETVLMNSTYRSPDWGEFQLQDGVYYRTPPIPQESPEAYTTRFHGPVINGDINADGMEDALVVLNTQNGGTGHFIELAAVLNQNGIPYNAATVFLGDRVVIENGLVENGIIVLTMRVHGPDDGLCCPSQPATWRYAFTGGQLVKLP